jgi:hypothetical protein
MYLIPPTYKASREAFRAYLPTIQSRWPDAVLESHPLSGQEALTIDWIHATGSQVREKLLIVTTGLHGIEGYAGAWFLNLFVHEYLPKLDPKTTGLLLVHPINAWGMKHRRRVNPNNVDLNRNFVRGKFIDNNPDYLRLDGLLNPTQQLGGIFWAQVRFGARLVRALLSIGAGRIKEAMLKGQIVVPQGVYFGGQAVQEETQAMMELFQQVYAAYRQVLHLDIHTGYGPRGRLTMVNATRERRERDELTRLFNYPLIAAMNPSEFYIIDGDMIEWIYALVQDEFPDKRLFATTFEYGTLGDSLPALIRSMAATIFENQAFHHGVSNDAHKTIHAEYKELFLPTDPAWTESILRDTRRTLDGVLAAEGFVE